MAYSDLQQVRLCPCECAVFFYLFNVVDFKINFIPSLILFQLLGGIEKVFCIESIYCVSCLATSIAVLHPNRGAQEEGIEIFSIHTLYRQFGVVIQIPLRLLFFLITEIRDDKQLLKKVQVSPAGRHCIRNGLFFFHQRSCINEVRSTGELVEAGNL